MNMKKFIKNNNYFISYLLMFIGLFSMAFYMYLYSCRLIDKSVYEFAFNLRYNLIWLFFSLSWILFFMFLFYIVKNKRKLLLYNIIINLIFCNNIANFVIR
jgi:hypothetical protein